MEMNHDDFGPEAFACSGGETAPDGIDELPPEVEVLGPQSAADASVAGAASYSANARLDAGSASIEETVVEQQGVHKRTRVTAIRFRRLQISVEQSWR
ncbi:MAG TPA: hypothetical protein VMA53_05475 [Stellaceae bacterium]|nr:hypothetical protein [Stellaceae bacterium]